MEKAFRIEDVLEKREINKTRKLLEKYELTGVIDIVSDKLSELTGCSYSKEQYHMEVSTIANYFLTKVNAKVSLIKSQKEKKNLQHAIAKVARGYIKNLTLFYIDPEIQETIFNSLKNASDYKGYNFSEILELLEVQRSNDIVLSKHPSSKKECRLEWLKDKKAISELSFILLKNKWIARRKGFEELFNPMLASYRCIIEVKYINHFTWLFHELKEMGFFEVIGNRGYFSFLELYVVDKSGQKISTGKLKSISHYIKNSSKKHSFLKAEIQSIIKKIATND